MARSVLRLLVASAVASIALFGTPRPAHADDPRPQPKPRATSTWYGWQTLIVDGGSLLTAPLGIGLGGYVVGGPIVHVAHGRWPIALASLGVRIAAPLGLGLAGLLVAHRTCRGGDFCGLGGLVIGGGIGIAGAVAIDAASFARVDRDDDPSVDVADDLLERVTSPKRASIGPTFAPRFSSEHELAGVDVGIGGVF